MVGGRRPLPSEIYAQTDPSPLKNADFDRFPLITSQTIGDSKKSSITTNIVSRPRAFQRAIGGVCTLITPKSRKGGSESDFLFFFDKSKRLIVSGAVNLVRR